MPIVTIVYGLILVALGVVAYISTNMVSVTALIPAFFGVPVLISGFIARDESKLKHAMHAAAMLGLLGCLGTFGGLFKSFKLLGGEEVARPEAVTVQAIMCSLSLVFVALCVRSFIQARKAKQQQV